MKKIFYLPLMFLPLFISECSKNNDTVKPDNTIDFSIRESHSDTAFRVNDVIQLADSSFIMVGGASIHKGNFQNLVMKYDKNGKRVWISIKSNTDSPKGFSRVFAVTQNKISAYRDKGFTYDLAPRIVDYNTNGKYLDQNYVNTYIDMNAVEYVSGNFFLAGGKNGVVAFQELDPNGSSKWLKFYYSGKSMLSLSDLSDTSFVAIGGGDISISTNQLMTLNNKGDTLKTFPYKGFVVKGLQNGDFLATTGGTTNVQFRSFDQSGSVKWSSDKGSSGVTNAYPSGCYSILEYDKGYFIFTMIGNDGNLYCYEYDIAGKLVNTIQINDIGSDTRIAINKTFNNGLIVVKSVSSTTPGDVEIIKYSDVTP